MSSEKKKRKLPVPVAVLLVLVFAVGIVAGVYFSQYTVIAGEQIRRDTVSLDFRDKGITDPSVFAKLKDLRELDLRGNDVSTESVLALKELLPECTVLYDVEVGEEKHDVLITELELEDLPADWEHMRELTYLTSLTVERCTNPAAMAALQTALPDCAMQWTLGLGGQWYDVHAKELDLTGSAVGYDELNAQLRWFDALETVTLRDALLTPAEQTALQEAYPELSFVWPIRLGEQVLQVETGEILFSEDEAVDMTELETVVGLLPELKAVDFTDSGAGAEDRVAFREAHPELDVSWRVTLWESEYPCDTELLDFSGMKFGPEEQAILEDALPYFPELKKVDMCDCGLSNEEMDALNKKYDAIKFVWRVYFSRYNLRTDATYFRTSEYGKNPPGIVDKDTEIMKYLTDLQGLDVGHQYFSDLHFLEFMPHMTYLIIAECPVQDLSPLSTLKELRYLEAFSTPIQDISPLAQCPSLKSLNLCYTSVRQDNAWDTINKMTWLERLWWCNDPFSPQQRNQLIAERPDCTFFFLHGGESSGGSWRYHQYYYEMRDFFHAPYMASGTNGVDEDGNQIIIDDHGTEFHLENYDGSTYWWTQPQWSDLHPYIIGVTA
ncbi:MAG: hypothetical protein IJT62_00295 [Oscillospiraceae bacterium]|nr:hypothetical protein [Oscillospiraceae bacterium]